MTTTTEPTPTAGEAAVARRRLAAVANALATARLKAGELLTTRKNSTAHPGDDYALQELRGLELAHARAASEAVELENEASALQSIVSMFDQREAARVRTEQAEQRQRDLATAATLAAERISAAADIDDAFAKLAAAFDSYEKIGFALERIEQTTGVSSAQLFARPAIAAAAMHALPERLARALNVEIVFGRTPLVEAQRGLLGRFIPQQSPQTAA